MATAMATITATHMKSPMERTDAQVIEPVAKASRFRLVLLAAMAITGICLATTTAAEQVLRKSNPDLALQINPENANALTVKVQRLISDRGLEKPNTRKLIESLAKRSIRSELVNPRSLAALGAVYEANGDRERAFPLFSVASKMTQRELFAQLWLANYEAQDGKFEDALKHYDIMLRVSPRTSQLLFPVLAQAMVNPGSWPAYRQYFESPPEWFFSFVRFVIHDKNAIAPAVMIMSTGSRLPDSELYNALEGETLGSLFQRHNFVEAAKFMAAIGGGPKVGRSVSFSGDNRDDRFGPFAWQPSSNASVGGGYESQLGGTTPAFRASAAAISSGVVLSKALVLADGNYEFYVPYSFVEGGEASQARWRGICADGQTLFDHALRNTQAPRTARIAFKVGAECRGQTIQLIVTGGDTYPGVEVLILEPSLRSVQNTP